MKTSKCFKHATNMVVHSKLRSWLTIIGIVIGVASVVAIISLGQGLQDTVNNQLGNLGGDILTLSAGFSRGGNMFGPQGDSGRGGGTATTKKVVLSRSDVQALKVVSNIAYIETDISGRTEVSYLGKSGTVSLTGVDQKVWSQVTTSKVKEGRMLDSADQNVIVIGGGLASTYFGQTVGINMMLNVNGSAYRVVGILNDSSTRIVMPIDMAYRVLSDKSDGVYDSITIKVKDEALLDTTITNIEQKLMVTRHVTNSTKDFSVSSSKEMQTTRASMMSSMTMFLTAIAAVSLLVGAVGIANTMFTSVLEKTKEIGIMKAIGASNQDIMLIFVLNAGTIGLVGGIIGCIFGVLLSGLLPMFMGDMRMFGGGTLVTFNTIACVLAISFLSGIISGVIPAYQASKLKPVDALRYE